MTIVDRQTLCMSTKLVAPEGFTLLMLGVYLLFRLTQTGELSGNTIELDVFVLGSIVAN